MRGPWWFRILVALLLLWSATGMYACIQQLRIGAEAMGAANEYDRAAFARLPSWYMADYAIGAGSMLLGVLALMIGSVRAVPLFTIALVALMIQFGWMLAFTDIVAARGVWVIYFPLLILAVAALSLKLAHLARRSGWIA